MYFQLQRSKLRKKHSKCIEKSSAWDLAETDIFSDICYQAALQNDEYYDFLIDSAERTLIEAVTGETKWASGLNKNDTKHTLTHKLPGFNKMGKIHMIVRSRLCEEKVQKDKDKEMKEKEDKDKGKPVSTDCSMSVIDHHYKTMVGNGDIIDKSPSDKQFVTTPSSSSNVDGSPSNICMAFGKGFGRGDGSPDNITIGRGRCKRPHSKSSSPGMTPPFKLHINANDIDADSFADAHVDTSSSQVSTSPKTVRYRNSAESC